MRTAIVCALLAALATSALAQYPPVAYVGIDLPPEGSIAVVHPTQPARLYRAAGIELTSLEVCLGEFDYNHWGECHYVEPLAGATAVEITAPYSPEGFTILESILPLDGPPGADGWTSFDVAGLRGGGHSDGPVELLATVPGFTDCYLDNVFELEIRSPDINGDLMVNLSDIVLFALALGDYVAYADLWPDGVIDLGDVVMMAQALQER